MTVESGKMVSKLGRNASWRQSLHIMKTNRMRAIGKMIIVLIMVVGIIVLLSGAVTIYQLTSGNLSRVSTTSTDGNPTATESVTEGSLFSTASATSISSTFSQRLRVGVNNGNMPPDFPIAIVNGTNTTLYKFLGRPVLLWFVTTWCSSCQQAAQMLNQQYYTPLASKGVVIITVELYNDLGQSGANLTQFANNYGGGLYKQMWYYGYSNQTTTYVFDPKAALDVYYAINSQGVIVEQGIGLPSALATLSSDAFWIQS